MLIFHLTLSYLSTFSLTYLYTNGYNKNIERKGRIPMKTLPEENKRLNKRLQDFRKEAHIQQQEMADYCGLSKNYLSAMERGINKCNAHVLISYAKKLNVSLDILTGLQSSLKTETDTILPELKAIIEKMSYENQKKLLEILNILDK